MQHVLSATTSLPAGRRCMSASVPRYDISRRWNRNSFSSRFAYQINDNFGTTLVVIKWDSEFPSSVLAARMEGSKRHLCKRFYGKAFDFHCSIPRLWFLVIDAVNYANSCDQRLGCMLIFP